MEIHAAAKTQRLSMLETMEVLGSSCGNADLSPQEGVGSVGQVKWISTSASSKGTKRRSWKPLCSSDTVTELPPRKWGGMVHTAAVLQLLRGTGKEGEGSPVFLGVS